jgi:hypothetical protein
MRGRKKDSEFLCDFISSCVKNGKTSSDDITAEAKTIISDIDGKIIEVEKLKLIRSKLLDVVLFFDKTIVQGNQLSKEAKILSLFKIPNQNICKFICNNIKKSATKISDLQKSSFNIADLNFSIKQLLDNKVILKTNETLLKDEYFNDYMKLVLRE